MKEVIFLGGLIPDDNVIRESTINFMNSAADAFQNQLINGIKRNGYVPIVLSAPFIGSYPKNYSKAFFRAHSYPDGHKYVSFNNVWGLRNYSRYRSLIRELKKKEYKGVNKVIVYSVHTPFARVAMYLKKRNPDVKICLVVPDLPEYMNLRTDKSLLYRIAKKFDCRSFYRLTEYFDCFSLVSVYQSAKVNKLNKQQTVVEAIADEVQPIFVPLKNEKKRIVYTGSLHKQFGIMNLVEAVNGMDGKVELVLCGSGDALPEIASLDSDKIKYLGVLDRESVRQVQLSADVLVNPRTNEGEYTKYSFPSKIMEYLSTGRPVVCNKLDGIPDEYHEFLIYPKDESVVELRKQLNWTLSLDTHLLEGIFRKNTTFLRDSKNSKTMVSKILAMLD